MPVTNTYFAIIGYIYIYLKRFILEILFICCTSWSVLVYATTEIEWMCLECMSCSLEIVVEANYYLGHFTGIGSLLGKTIRNIYFLLCIECKPT